MPRKSDAERHADEMGAWAEAVAPALGLDGDRGNGDDAKLQLGLSEEQHELRRRGIGSSEIAAIAGLNPAHWKQPIDVWLEKTGKAGPRAPMTERQELGHMMEPTIAWWYMQRTHCGSMRKGDTIAHPTNAWALATPDYIRRDNRILEIKLVGARVRHHWRDGIPDYVLAQTLWQRYVSGLVAADVAVWFDMDTREILPAAWLPDVVEDLVETARDFWERFVIPDVPPPVDASENYAGYLRSRFPKSSEGMLEQVPDVANLWAQRWHESAAEIRVLEESQREAQNHLQSLIGDAAGFETERYRCTWKSDRTGRTAWKELALELGATQELIAKHTGEPSRRFLLRALKGGDEDGR